MSAPGAVVAAPIRRPRRFVRLGKWEPIVWIAPALASPTWGKPRFPPRAPQTASAEGEPSAGSSPVRRDFARRGCAEQSSAPPKGEP